MNSSTQVVLLVSPLDAPLGTCSKLQAHVEGKLHRAFSIFLTDGEGNVLLSQRNIVNRKVWDAVIAAHEAGEFVKGVGKESVKGGLIANVDGIRAFIPASLLSLRYVEKIE